MTVLFLVLPLALVIVAVAVLAFVWAAERGQFDDLDTPAVRLLHDDEPVVPPHAVHRDPGGQAEQRTTRSRR